MLLAQTTRKCTTHREYWILLQVTAILGRKMETHNEVYLNNLLSIPLVCGLVVAFGEHRNLQVRPHRCPRVHAAACAKLCRVLRRLARPRRVAAAAINPRAIPKTVLLAASCA